MTRLNSYDADAPNWHIEQERPFDSVELEKLADIAGYATDWTPTTKWSHVDVDVIMQHVVKVATQILSNQQLVIFLAYYVEHKTSTEIAAQLGCSDSNVVQSLHGIKRADGWWRKKTGVVSTKPDRGVIHSGGSVTKLRVALATDETFKAIVGAAKAKPDEPTKVLRWFAPARLPSKAHLNAPLLTLLVMSELADSKGDVKVADVMTHLSAQVVNGTLTTMRLMNWVTTDGITARIVMTPLHEDEERRIA